MHEIQATVLSVEGRTTRTGKTLYDVALSDGQKYTVFDNALATQAHGLNGQTVQAQVDVSQNGQYTNYKLIAIRPVVGGGVGSIVQLNPPGGSLSAPLPTNAPIPMAPQAKSEDPEERAARIVRQNVLGTAHNFIAHLYTGAGPDALEEASAKALALAKELFGHAFGNKTEATPTTAPEVAAQVNEVLGTPSVTTGAQATQDW